MKTSDAAPARRTATRLTRMGLAAIAIVLAAAACSHRPPPGAPPGSKPHGTKPPTTKVTPPTFPCPRPIGDVTPARPCPPPCRPQGQPFTCPCVATSPANDMIPCPEPGTGIPGLIATKDFAAWVDLMPGPIERPRPLIVTGTLVFATAGYQAKLVPATPQGFNPRILLLNLVVTPPSGPVAQVITEQEIRFESPDGLAYDRVTILPVGLDLEVMEAH